MSVCTHIYRRAIYPSLFSYKGCLDLNTLIKLYLGGSELNSGPHAQSDQHMLLTTEMQSFPPHSDTMSVNQQVCVLALKEFH